MGLHVQECFRYLGYQDADLPETNWAAQEVVALPIFPELTADEQERVVNRIGEFFGKSRGGHGLAGPKYLKHPVGRAAKTE